MSPGDEMIFWLSGQSSASMTAFAASGG